MKEFLVKYTATFTTVITVGDTECVDDCVSDIEPGDGDYKEDTFTVDSMRELTQAADPEEPQFVNDCPDCTFHGRIEGSRSADVYTCTKAAAELSIIIRYSSDPYDFSSIPMLTAKKVGAMTPEGDYSKALKLIGELK